MTNKKAFTLVELLAVIVILGIILLIAVPKITSAITSASEASFISSVKMIAASVEREATVRQTLGNEENIACSDVATYNSTDYDVCNIAFNGDEAQITICGKANGKFDGMCVCYGTRNVAVVADQCGGSIE